MTNQSICCACHSMTWERYWLATPTATSPCGTRPPIESFASSWAPTRDRSLIYAHSRMVHLSPAAERTRGSSNGTRAWFPLEMRPRYAIALKCVYYLQSLFASQQLPEQYGGIRTLTTGKGAMLIVGTTKNCVLQGTMTLNFSMIIQVSKCCGYDFRSVKLITTFILGTHTRTACLGRASHPESICDGWL